MLATQLQSALEMFVRSFDDLTRVNFDLVVCDEGHRLKNEKVKASTMLSQMDTQMRVVLTGTPLQNDLKEFYALVCVVNPNVFGTSSVFAKNYEEPIVKSKQPEASWEELEEGRMKAEQLSRLTAKFILRRTQDVISKFLPPKTELVVFCRPTPLQSYIYSKTLNGLQSVSSLDSTCVLASIMQLRKICNHPSLSEADQSHIPADLLNSTFEEQGSKLAVVSYLLHHLREAGSEKIVLVSISTQVLDLLGDLCQHYSFPFLRLDGSTSALQRQNVVTTFNGPYGKESVLLLSSKAGGTGLNLIGASRILLYDMDWNPAHDIQAMARVWRDGQTKPVKVYRLVTTGTIEEKIFQRQITKQGLGGGVVDGTSSRSKSSQFHFSSTDLKDLFSFRDDTDCDTHELLNCSCEGTGNNVVSGVKSGASAEGGGGGDQVRECQLGEGSLEAEPGLSATGMKDLLSWQHLSPPIGQIPDDGLSDALEYITYAFVNVHEQKL